jgi:hypothetical protein
VGSVDITCSYCKKKGHSTEECRKKKYNGETKEKTVFKGRKGDEDEKWEKNWTLLIDDPVNKLSDATTATSDSENEEDEATTSTTEWILDSGCARHLTGSPNLLTSNISTAQTPLHLPDGSTVNSIKRGTVATKSKILGQTNILDKANVELLPGLKKNLLSYACLEQKGILVYEGKKRYLVSASAKVVEVFESGNLLVVRFRAMDKEANADMICSVLAEQDHPGVHEDSL